MYFQTHRKEMEDGCKEREGLNDTISHLKQVSDVLWSVDK